MRGAYYQLNYLIMTKFKLRMFVLAIAIVISVSFFSSCEKKDMSASTTTLRTKEIVLNGTAGSSINGKAVFAENSDHSANILITLQNTVKDTTLVMHIHNGTIASPGTIAIPLSNITGTGAQATGTTLNVTTATSPAGSVANITYDNIITYAGYIEVHSNASPAGKMVANADIK
jgi:hypothetical protein